MNPPTELDRQLAELARLRDQLRGDLAHIRGRLEAVKRDRRKKGAKKKLAPEIIPASLLSVPAVKST